MLELKEPTRRRETELILSILNQSVSQSVRSHVLSPLSPPRTGCCLSLIVQWSVKGCGLGPYYWTSPLSNRKRRTKRTLLLLITTSSPSVLPVESVRVNKVMKLNLHDNKTITNQDAKKLFYETLGFPLQTVCKYAIICHDNMFISMPL